MRIILIHFPFASQWKSWFLGSEYKTSNCEVLHCDSELNALKVYSPIKHVPKTKGDIQSSVTIFQRLPQVHLNCRFYRELNVSGLDELSEASSKSVCEYALNLCD